VCQAHHRSFTLSDGNFRCRSCRSSVRIVEPRCGSRPRRPSQRFAARIASVGCESKHPAGTMPPLRRDRLIRGQRRHPRLERPRQDRRHPALVQIRRRPPRSVQPRRSPIAGRFRQPVRRRDRQLARRNTPCPARQSLPVHRGHPPRRAHRPKNRRPRRQRQRLLTERPHRRPQRDRPPRGRQPGHQLPLNRPPHRPPHRAVRTTRSIGTICQHRPARAARRRTVFPTPSPLSPVVTPPLHPSRPPAGSAASLNRRLVWLAAEELQADQAGS